MDHLRTDAERKARWYCQTVWPRYLPVRKAERWTDLLQVPPQKKKETTATKGLQVLSREELLNYAFVYSLPYEWLKASSSSAAAANSAATDSVSMSSGGSPQSNNTPSRGACEPKPADTTRTAADTAATLPPPDLLRRVLDTHGFAVVSGVVSSAECHHALDLAWDWMEAASAAERHVQKCGGFIDDMKESNTTRKSSVVDRHEPLTHSKAGTAYFPRTVEGGMMPFYGSGHSSFAWSIRSHPAVQQVFAALHGGNTTTSDLVSSLDGIVVWTEAAAAEQQHPSLAGDTGWFHVDQNPKHKPGPAAVQGLVNLLTVDATTTGGNVLVVQSHLEFAHGHYYSNNDDSTSSHRPATDSDANGALRADNTPVASSDDDRVSRFDKTPPLSDESVRAFYEQRLMEVGTDDWLEIDPHDSLLLVPCRIVTVLLGAGDVLLWDSRVAHCSYPPPPPPSVRTRVEPTTTTAAVDDSGGMHMDAATEEARHHQRTSLESTICPAPTADVTSRSYNASSRRPLARSDHRNNKGLLRAATLVSMVPATTIPEATLQARKQAVHGSRTLTHWVDKVAFLGEERSEDVALERDCVDFMKAAQQQHLNGSSSSSSSKPKVIYDWDDLSDDQKRLVVGKKSD